MTQDVTRLQRERQGLEQQIADLFAFYAKQKQAGKVSQHYGRCICWTTHGVLQNSTDVPRRSVKENMRVNQPTLPSLRPSFEPDASQTPRSKRRPLPDPNAAPWG